MPTFDFRCKKCGHLFEETVPFGSKKGPNCPDCNAKDAEKLLTPPLGIHFKGQGFYKTDAAGRNPAPDAAKEKPTKPDSGSKSTPSSKPGAV